MLTDLDKFQNICLWQGGNLLQSDGREGITPVRWQGGNLHQSDGREGIYTSQMTGREFTPVPDGREGIYTSQILINVQAFLLRQVW
jgi:hypothetical protein